MPHLGRGANHTEAVRSAIQRCWNYYLFSSYRAGRGENAFIQSFFGAGPWPSTWSTPGATTASSTPTRWPPATTCCAPPPSA
ncbi:MAG: hypothetical protein R3F43_18240 [bacterium]